MFKVLVLFLTLPVTLTAQIDIDSTVKGIHFERNVTWKEVMEMAKKQQKWVFVDCFATWCGPCKMMDKEIYVDDTVGTMFNRNFISVKVQCDTNKNDLPAIQREYKEAHQITLKYKINVYPSFLFFSPNGEIVHKATGYLNKSDLIRLSIDARDTTKQYFTLLKKYERGELDYPSTLALINEGKNIGEKDISATIARSYMVHYLQKLNENDLCKRENFYFVASNISILKSTDTIFSWFLRRSATVDSIVSNKGFSNSVVNFVIYKEEISAELSISQNTNLEPNWETMSERINQRFGSKYVEDNILSGKVNWYRQKKEWEKYSKCLVQKLKLEKIEDVPKTLSGIIILNGNAWEIFKHSNDYQELATAISWCDVALQIPVPSAQPTVMDTKANLLFKLGQIEEALSIESKALVLDPNDKDIRSNFEKMKIGKQTW